MRDDDETVRAPYEGSADQARYLERQAMLQRASAEQIRATRAALAEMRQGSSQWRRCQQQPGTRMANDYATKCEAKGQVPNANVAAMLRKYGAR